MHGMGYKKRERFCTAGRAARHRRETPLCAYAKQLQKGDHWNGYFCTVGDVVKFVDSHTQNN